MFLNREKETERIREVVRMNKSHAKAILVYGLRRVGKTTLIQNALSGYEGTVISYLAVEDTYLSNIRQLAKCAADTLNMPYLSSVEDMDALFSIIADTGRKIVVVLDEYPLLKKSFRDGNLDSYFQRLVDRLKDNVTLIFCGSYLSVMRKMGNYEEPMYGRFDLELHLRTFDYYESSAFYSSLSSPEKILYYSVFGGFPFVLERLQPEKGFEWNIKRAFLDSWDIVYSTINEILMTEINKLEYAGAILSYLKNGKARNNEIASVLNASASSVSKEVSRLTDMDLIEKNNPINRKDDAKKTFYEISDNLLRFFYTYIMPGRNYIAQYGPDAAYDNLVLPSLDTYISKRFEKIVREYFTRVIRERKNRDFLESGTYWYDLPREKKNGEFDCVVKMKDGYMVVECKYLKDPMTVSLATEEERKILDIKEFEIRKIGFACSSGFSFSKAEKEWMLIDGDELYTL